ITTVAQEWADHLLPLTDLEHRNPNEFGENLFSSSSSAPRPPLDPRAPVQSWYDEIQFYNQFFGREPDLSSFDQWGHFTQLIWKGSTRLGVGCASSEGNRK